MRMEYVCNSSASLFELSAASQRAYKYLLITIRWIGTHSEYDKRNKERSKGK